MIYLDLPTLERNKNTKCMPQRILSWWHLVFITCMQSI